MLHAPSPGEAFHNAGCEINVANAWSSLAYTTAAIWLIFRGKHEATTYLLALLGTGSFVCHASKSFPLLRAFDGACITGLFIAIGCGNRQAWSRWLVLVFVPFYIASSSLPDPKHEIWVGRPRPDGLRILAEDIVRAAIVLAALAPNLNIRTTLLWLTSLGCVVLGATGVSIFHDFWHLFTSLAFVSTIHTQHDQELGAAPARTRPHALRV